MPRPTHLLAALPAIFGSSALITFAIVALLQVRAVFDAAAANTARVNARENDPWRLRPGDVIATNALGPAEARARPASAVPDERRLVRVVYPGLAGSR